MHPRSQGTRVEAQDRCGPGLSLDVPSGFRKGFKDQMKKGALRPLWFLRNGYGQVFLFPAVLAGLQEIEGNAGCLGHPFQLVFGSEVIAADRAGGQFEIPPPDASHIFFFGHLDGPVGQMKWQAPQPMQTPVGSA